MHAVNLYIDENLDDNRFQQIRTSLMSDNHITNVAFHSRKPHDVLVEYDEAYVTPRSIISQLESSGLHVDIVGG